MSKQRIAVPAVHPGGLNALTSAHFGHCDVFVLVDVEEGQIVREQNLSNPGHAGGGCLVPVQMLAEQEVDVIISGGMGHGPRMGFQQAGIKVFLGRESTVKQAVEDYLQGKLTEMSERHLCRGGGHCS
ncbi:MAG TPA: dinitrogenase iron-molybdenum cofactor biosynthesis protein [Clostridia bacterium]|nr:dinitrogenase iron-molybdenum cofactor biosynthesis protein [Clostridia bacterium]